MDSIETLESITITLPEVPAPSLEPCAESLYPPIPLRPVTAAGEVVTVDEDTADILPFFSINYEEAFKVDPPAKPQIKDVKTLRNNNVTLPDGKFFVDRILPGKITFETNKTFPVKYFTDLHNKIRASGTYNHLCARIPLEHNNLKVEEFRNLLGNNYSDLAVCQLIEFGFPLGLSPDSRLEPTLKNHSSSYEYFEYVDNFVASELRDLGITGPMDEPAISPVLVSPLMTSTKKPSSRRAVFDATYGENSINNNTPVKEYLGDFYNFKFPSVTDLADRVIKLGAGCLLWKRDLSRWFMQLKVDPADLDKLGFVWRGKQFLFTSLIWGCRNAGYNAQRVSSCVSFIHQKLGLTISDEEFFSIVYIDDFAGCEKGDRAFSSYDALGNLLSRLGIEESKKKACPPSTVMTFLGIEVDTINMCLRVDKVKLKEILDLITNWKRRTTATKEELQSLLGKLIFVSRAVRFSRCFVGRIIREIKKLKLQKQKITLSDDVRKDFLWWFHFLSAFNGVELLSPATVSLHVLGDATPMGGGSWNWSASQYFSMRFPTWLCSPDIPIHIKEFLVLIVSCKIWGKSWAGKRIALHCDNDSICDTIVYLKPKDAELQNCLREFLLIVCKYNFHPVILKIGTKENHLADFISRNFNRVDIDKVFNDNGVPNMMPVDVTDDEFLYTADW